MYCNTQGTLVLSRENTILELRERQEQTITAFHYALSFLYLLISSQLDEKRSE